MGAPLCAPIFLFIVLLMRIIGTKSKTRQALSGWYSWSRCIVKRVIIFC